MRFVHRTYCFFAYCVSWAIFFGVGFALNVLCIPLLLAPDRPRGGAAVRELIHRLFIAWCAWLHLTRLIYVDWEGFTPEALEGPAVYIANHPGLLDAPFILARLTDTICIFKPKLMRNPALGPAAVMAGYASGNAGVDLIRDVAERVARGHSLLVFPEGTRTAANVALNPLKPGFALIAARAGVPVRLLAVHAPRDLLPKGRSWWRMPRFPAHVRIVLLGELNPDGAPNATELTARAARQLSEALAAT
jgi:1-acyl-sn-glycerol-3-phosphate acyltransferase